MVQTNMRPAVTVLVLLSSPSCIAADLCATLGCSVHKQDGAACQCNYHCNVHHDCCADVAAVCQNRTDPCLTHSGGCKHGGGGNVTTGHKAEHTKSSEHVKSPEHAKAKSSTASAEATHSSKAHAPSAEGASTADATHSSGHASKSDGKKGGPHDHVAGSGKASGTSGKVAGAAGAKEKEHSKESEKDKDKNKEKEKEKASGTQHESHTHHTPHTHSSSTTPWVVVVLACITGLTLPITISIILVLRARCAHRAHRAQPRAAVRSRAQPCARCAPSRAICELGHAVASKGGLVLTTLARALVCGAQWRVLRAPDVPAHRSAAEAARNCECRRASHTERRDRGGRVWRPVTVLGWCRGASRAARACAGRIGRARTRPCACSARGRVVSSSLQPRRNLSLLLLASCD